MKPIIFHIDVNSAFLSWTAIEELKNGSTTDLRLIPSIIGGSQKKRHGVVLAKSIPAKAFGVRTGEPIAHALRKCESLTIAPPDHAMYRRHSKRLIELLHTYTPDLEKLSIDECYLNFGPIAHKYESPIVAAQLISDDIKRQLGFTVNIGIAPNRLLAKMASDFEKPDKIHTLFQEEIPSKLWPLPIEDLYMVGKSSANRLRALGITTIGDLAHTDQNFLVREFKSHGKLMWEYANGIASSTICSDTGKLKGIGNSTTLSEDITIAAEAKKILLSLAKQVSSRLQTSKQLAQTVTVEIKNCYFHTCSHQRPLLFPTNTISSIYELSCRLFDELWDKTPIRLLGIRTGKLLDEDAPIQMNLFEMEEIQNMTFHPSNKKQQNLDAALKEIKNRFGEDAIMRGSLLNKESPQNPK
ncbi:MAG: DNA polymerase IV [Lachnospiraceae bacterium]|nr:DNA polymerase IV [Lachnospiraceae bacterium]